MNISERRVYDALVRVLGFAGKYPRFFAQGSRESDLIGQIEDAAKKLSAGGISHTIGRGAVQQTSEERAAIRASLSNQLTVISKTATSMDLSQFWLPRDRSDRALVEFGHKFVLEAEPLQQKFLECRLPPDFIDQLKATVAKLDQTITRQAVCKGDRRNASATVIGARDAAVGALQRLDPLMDNVLREEAPVLAEWQSARRIARPSKTRAIATPPP